MYFRSSPGAFLILALLSFTHFVVAQTTPLAFKRGHQGWLRTYALSPSNKFVVTAGSDHQLILWDYASNKQVREIQEPGDIISLAISPDDRYLFSADTACKVKKWDLLTGKLLFEFTAHGAKDPNTEDDGGVFIAGDYQQNKYVKEEYEWTKVKVDPYLDENIKLLISSDGRHLITGGRDAKINVWDTKTGKLINSFFAEGQRKITSLVLSKDLKYLISMDHSDQVIIRHYASGKVITKFSADVPIHQTHLSKDQQYLLYLPDHDTLAKVQLSNGQVLFSKKLPHRLSRLVSVVDETQIVGMSWPDSIFYINALKGEILHKQAELIEEDGFSLDLRGQLLVLSDNGKKLSAFDPVKGVKTEKLGVFVPDIQKIEFSENGKNLLVNDADIKLDLFEFNTSNKALLANIPLHDPWYQHHSQLSPDARQLAIVAASGELRLWNLNNLSFQSANPNFSSMSAARRGWKSESPVITGLKFTSDGSKIIAADYTNGLCFFDTQQPKNNYYAGTKPSESYNLFQVRKDSSAVLINNGRGFGYFTQFDLSDLSQESIQTKDIQERFSIRNFKERLIDFDFSKDYTLLIYHTKGADAGIVETKSSQNLISFHQCSMAKWIGPNKRFALLQAQQKVVIWDASTRKILLQYNLPFSPVHAALHPSGHYFLLVRPDQGIEFRHTLSGEIVLTMYWRAGTKDFYIQNPQGQVDPQGWQKLSTVLLQSNAQTLEAQLLQQVTARPSKPEGIEDVILNIGHADKINHLSIHHKDQFLFTRDADHRYKIWDLSSGRELRTLVHEQLAEKPMISAPEATGKITFWGDYKQKWELDLNTGELEETSLIWKEVGIPLPKGYHSFMYRRDWTAPWKFILPGGEVFQKTSPRSFEIHSMIFNPDKRIFSFFGYLGGYGKNAIISFYGNNFQDSIILRTEFLDAEKHLQEYSILPGTDSLVAKTFDGDMLVFSPLDSKLTTHPFIDQTPLAALRFSQDGQVVARSIKKKSTVEIWDNSTKKLLLKRTFLGAGELIHLAFNQAGTHLVLSDGVNIWDWNLKQDSVHRFFDFKMKASYPAYILATGSVIFANSFSDIQNGARFIDLRTGAHKVISVPNFFSSDLFPLQDKILAKDLFGQYANVLNPEDSRFLGNQALKAITSTLDGQWYGLIYEKTGEFGWWDVQKESLVFTKKGTGPFLKMALNRSGTLIALSDRNQVLILDTKTGQEKLRIPHAHNYPEDVILQFSEDSHFIFFSYARQISIWDLQNNKHVNDFKLNFNSSRIIGASNNGQIIYTADSRYLSAYDQQGKEIFSINFRETSFTSQYFPLEQKIIVATYSGILYKLDANTGDIEQTIYLGKQGKWIAVDQEKNVQTSPNAAGDVHMRTKGGQIALFAEQFGPKTDSAFTPLPPLLPALKTSSTPTKAPANSASNLALINEVWKTQLQPTGSSSNSVQVNSLHLGDNVLQGHISGDEQRLIFQLNSGELVFVEKNTQRLLKTVAIPQMDPIKSVMSADGRYLACVSGGQNIHLYNPQNGTLVKQKKLVFASISALAMSADGKKLLIGTLEGRIQGFNLPELSPAFELWPSDKKITCLAINDENDEVAGLDLDRNLFVYNILTAESLKNPLFISNENHSSINQILFTHQSSILIVTENKIYTLPYTEAGKASTLPIVGRDYQLLADPNNTDRFYIASTWITRNCVYYDLKKGEKLDSLKNIYTMFGISRSGRFALINSLGSSVQRVEVLTMETGQSQRERIPTLSAGIDALMLDKNALYYRNSSSYYPNVYKINLANLVTEKLPGSYREGTFLPEQDKISYVGTMYKQFYGYGKKILGDTNITWLLKAESCAVMTSENGQYVALLCKDANVVSVYSNVTQKLIHQLPLKTEVRTIKAISNDAKWLLTESDLVGVQLYDLSLKQLIYTNEQSIGPIIFSKDNRSIIFRHLYKYLVYDPNVRKVIKEIPFDAKQLYPLFLFANARFGIENSEEPSYKLWDLAKRIELGAFHFFNLPNQPPAWVFISTQGEYDGSTNGLQQLYHVDQQSLSSKNLDLKNDPKYQPGLLAKLLK